MSESDGARVNLVFKWRGVEYSLPNIDPSVTTVLDLKLMIQNLTNILAERQKILGLIKTGQLNDSAQISSLGIKFKDNSFKFTLMGTPETELIDLNTKSSNSKDEVFNDLSCEFSSSTPEWTKLQEFTNATAINFIHEPRADKKLLVLDLDHTILHFTSKEEVTSESMKRPYMDAFLSEVYPHYDIAIWSQTHWRWVEIKLIELGILSHPHYKICFILDKTSMFSMDSGKVKPLHIIWSKFPQYWGKHNTLHVDDLARNFVLNKSSGLLITPYNRPTPQGAAAIHSGHNGQWPTHTPAPPPVSPPRTSGLLMPANAPIVIPETHGSGREQADNQLVVLSRLAFCKFVC
jgi:ubiquitin-like domain-containing CTD phosphatase 1